MHRSGPDVVVLRTGTEGLSMAAYAEELRRRLPDRDVALARTPSQERELVRHARVVTGTTIDEAAIESAENLAVFASTFAGVDHLPLVALARHGVAVTNASSIHAPGIAEQAIGNLLVFARRLDEGWRRKRRREWRHFQSRELAGSTVTIVGLGAIGTAIATRLSGFDVHTIGVRYTPEKGGPTDRTIGYDPADLHEALAQTDSLIIACPLTDTTRGLVGDAEFGTLPPEAVLVNVARGPIVDTTALVRALQTEAIRGAALDVTDPEPLPPDHPLWRLENCLLTPHTGGHTPELWNRLAEIVAGNVARLAETGSVDDLENLVKLPDVDG